MWQRASMISGGGGCIVDDTSYTKLQQGDVTYTFNGINKIKSILVYLNTATFSYAYIDNSDEIHIQNGNNIYIQSINNNEVVIRSVLTFVADVTMVAVGE